MSHLFSRTTAAVAALAVIAFGGGVAQAQTDQEVLVEQARGTLTSMRANADFAGFEPTLAEARGVLIFPELWKGGFIIGAEAGEGVLLVRQADGTWGPPAFYDMGGASIGLQLGGQVSEMVVAIMTDNALARVQDGEFTLGADANIALITLGAGLEARTALDTDAEMYAFSRNQGLFAGGAIEGSVITEDHEANAAYYGPGTQVADILNGTVQNDQSAGLQLALP